MDVQVLKINERYVVELDISESRYTGGLLAEMTVSKVDDTGLAPMLLSKFVGVEALEMYEMLVHKKWIDSMKK